MELGLIRKLVRLMTSNELTELEIDDPQSGMHVRLRRGSEPTPPVAPVVHVSPGTSLPAAAATAPAAPAAEAAAPEAAEGGHPPGTVPFLSPMVGTFYRAASPDSEPFVSPGSAIEPDTVLCIVEAMKVMNEIKAETRGEVLEVLAENGEPVEFGQPLFLIKPA